MKITLAPNSLDRIATPSAKFQRRAQGRLKSTIKVFNMLVNGGVEDYNHTEKSRRALRLLGHSGRRVANRGDPRNMRRGHGRLLVSGAATSQHHRIVYVIGSNAKNIYDVHFKVYLVYNAISLLIIQSNK
jgi:hypothetical protein